MTKFDGAGRPPAERIRGAPDRRPRRPLRHARGRLRRRAATTPSPTAARTLKELLPQARRARRATSRRRWRRTAGTWTTIASRLHKTRLREVLGVFVEQLKLDDAHFAVAELEQMLELAEAARRERRRAAAEGALHLRAGAGRHAHRVAAAGVPRLEQQPRAHRQAPASRGSWTTSTATAASTAWSRRCAPARCGCGWTCAFPASTATSRRCSRCAARSTTASSASSRASGRWRRCAAAARRTDRGPRP